MIWSFLKIAIFVVFVAAVALLADHLAASGPGIRVAIANTEFTLGPVQAVVALLVGLLAFWLLLRILGLLGALVRFLNGDETALSRHFDRNREQKGYRALADAMMSLASGEAKLAMSQATRAEKYLNKPELTNLLTAQAAEAGGDTRRATEAYKRLLGDERTRFVGVRGLMKQKVAEGETETALKLAQTAFALKPRHEEVQDTLLKLQAETGDWQGARKVLGAKLKQGLLPRDVYKRRDAVLALQEAKAITDETATIEAREAAIAANKMSPDLIPAAVLAADGYVRNGKPKYAARVLRKAWQMRPHPDLAAAFAAIDPDETPVARLKRFAPLMAAAPDDEETRLLRAELNIAAEDFPSARRAIGDLHTTHPTARTLAIMAAISRGEGESDSIVRGWLTRALTASRGPQWVCDNCHHVHADWGPVCDNCGGFDTLSWKEPPRPAMSLPNGAEMLPMIVGSDPAPEVHDASDTGMEVSDPAPADATAETGMILDENIGRKAQDDAS